VTRQVHRIERRILIVLTRQDIGNNFNCLFVPRRLLWPFSRFFVDFALPTLSFTLARMLHQLGGDLARCLVTACRPGVGGRQL
jgi:hypothetical protein